MPDMFGGGLVMNRRRKKSRKNADSQMDSKTVAIDETYTDRSDGGFGAVMSTQMMLVMPFSTRSETMPNRW